MRCHNFLTAAVVMLAPAVLPGADDAAEAKKLQGAWAVVSFETANKKPTDEMLKGMKVVFQGDAMTLFDGAKEEKGTFKLFPDTKPRSMDLTMPRNMRMEVALFIYELDGDNLKLCWRKPGGDRPGEFSAKDSNGLMVLKRAKQE